MAATFPHLNELVEESTRGLAEVVKKRMFGCDAYFVGDGIFALIWKTGRIGVRLTDETAYAELLALEGAEPWGAGPKQMAHWVLVPEAFHDGDEACEAWVRRAYQQNRGAKAAAKKVAKVAAKVAAKPAKKASTRA